MTGLVDKNTKSLLSITADFAWRQILLTARAIVSSEKAGSTVALANLDVGDPGYVFSRK
mgnify:CR=1 FL=1